MLLSRAALAFGLLGLTVARSAPEVISEAAFWAHDVLSAREDSAEDFCSPEVCRGEKDCLLKRDLVHPFIPQNYTDTGDASLLERDSNIDQWVAPPAGKIDAWFKTSWGSKSVIEIPHDDDDYTARYREFGDKKLKMGVKGMCGCTSVIVTARRGAFMSHHWEKPTIADAEKGVSGGVERFEADVLKELEDSLTCLAFDRKKDQDLQVAIYTKVDTTSLTVKYPKQVAKIKDTVAKKIPGLSAGDIKEVMYYTRLSESENLENSEGKVIIMYSPKEGGRGAGYQVWAGSQYTGNGRVDAAANNAPILGASW